MNYKPDEATLVSYHYGELEGEELQKVETYFREHPSERKRLQEWGDARKILTAARDKEVIAPPIILGDNHRSFWQEGYVRMSLGIAASFLVLLVSAKLLGLSATYKAGEMRLGFGKPVEASVTPTLSEEKVAAMIQSSLRESNQSLQAGWSEDRKRLEDNIKNSVAASSEKINQLVKKASAGEQEQVRDFVAQLQRDNLKLMKDYLQLSADGQKQYVETLLVDFSKYLQEQRKQDVQFFQSSMSNMQQNTDQFKKETEQILTTLITNTKPETQRSY